MTAETLYPVGPADARKRLDRFLHEKIPRVSRAYIQRAIRSRVSLSWEAEPKPSTPVRPGGCVRVGFSPLSEAPLSIAIPVLARGPGWLAVDKPAGVPVHPVNGARANTLVEVLRRQEGCAELRLVHRLDRETSGVLLFAEGAAAARFFSAEFACGRVRKEYLALVEGAMEGDHGEIGLPIRDLRGSRVHVRREAGNGGEPAVTRWLVEERGARRTLLRVFPITGRRHQIRVHLAAVGHPVVGDLLYGRPEHVYLELLLGDRDPRAEERGPSRHLLHCARLGFRTTAGQDREVVSLLPHAFHGMLAGPPAG